MEEALEQLAILVGAEHVDDVADKFKVRLPSTPPTSLMESSKQKKLVLHTHAKAPR